MKTLLTLILFLICQVEIGQSFVGKWGKLTNADKNPTIQATLDNDSGYRKDTNTENMIWIEGKTSYKYIPYIQFYINIEQDSNLIIVTKKYGKETFMQFIDRYLAESWTRQWEAYQQECWNDSICSMPYAMAKLDSTYVGEIADSAKISFFIYENGWEYFYRLINGCDRYSHEQPTFEGFMQYLERRLK